MPTPPTGLPAFDHPAPGTFEAIYAALEACSRPLIGPAQPRLLAIPICDATGIAGGLWGYTSFGWLQVQMLVLPEALRGRGIGAALMTAAEAEARRRGCLGAQVDTFSFQAEGFYRKLGYELYGTLDDCPPGHRRLFFCKRFDAGQGARPSATSPGRDRSNAGINLAPSGPDPIARNVLEMIERDPATVERMLWENVPPVS